MQFQGHLISSPWSRCGEAKLFVAECFKTFSGNCETQFIPSSSQDLGENQNNVHPTVTTCNQLESIVCDEGGYATYLATFPNFEASI